MSKGIKELFAYCAENPEFGEKLKSMKGEDAMKLLAEQGYDFSPKEFKEYVEANEELMDDEALKSAAGGMCTGHCGFTCETDCISCRMGDYM